MAFGGGQVDQAAFAEQIDLAAVAQRILLDEIARGAFGRRHLFERFDVDFHIEVAGIGNDGAILHRLEMILGENALVAGDGAEDVAELSRLVHGHDAEPVHHGFKSFGGIDLGDNDFGAGAAGAAGQPASAPAVTRDHELRSREQVVGGADDAVESGLARAVAVVEQVFGVRVIDSHDGETEDAFLRHGAQTDDAGGGLLGAADNAGEGVLPLGMEDGDQVGAVIHRDVRLVIDGSQNMAVIGVIVLALDGEDGDVVIAYQAGGDVILGRKRVGSAQHHVSAAVAQADGQVCRFRGHVQAGGDANALQWLVLDEFLANDLQNLHGLVGPVDPFLAQIGHLDGFDIAMHLRRCGRHASPLLR